MPIQLIVITVKQKKTFLSHLTIVERFYILPFSFLFRHQKSNLSADRAAPRQKYVGGWHGTGTPWKMGLIWRGKLYTPCEREKSNLLEVK